MMRESCSGVLDGFSGESEARNQALAAGDLCAGLSRGDICGEDRRRGVAMRARTAQWVAGWIAAGSIALIAGSMALAYVDRHLLSASMTTWDFSDVLNGVTLLAIPVIGFVIASRRPGNRIGWLFLAAGLASGVNGFSQSYGLRALLAAPGSLPAGRAAMWLSSWTLGIPIGLFAFVLLLFPTGQVRSRRWHLAAWFVGGVVVLWTAAVLVGATRS
jgi:hypothetical protein